MIAERTGLFTPVPVLLFKPVESMSKRMQDWIIDYVSKTHPEIVPAILAEIDPDYSVIDDVDTPTPHVYIEPVYAGTKASKCVQIFV